MIINNELIYARTNFPNTSFYPSVDRDSSITISGNRVIFSSRRMRRSGGSNLKLREQIEKFTKSSAYRLQRYLREAKAKLDIFVTLTYPESHAPTGKEAKRHLKLFFQRMHRLYANQRRSYSACWFMEFQENGTIHFHILQNKYIPKKMLAAIWADIVSIKDDTARRKHLKSSTRVEKFLSGRKGAGRYAAKYAKKQLQKEKPDEIGWIGSYWGKVGDVSVCAHTVDGDIFAQKCMKSESDVLNLAAKLVYWRKNEQIKVCEGGIFSRGVEYECWIFDNPLCFGVIKKWLLGIFGEEIEYVYLGWEK